MLFSQVFNAKVPVNLVKLKTGTHLKSNDVIVGRERKGIRSSDHFRIFDRGEVGLGLGCWMFFYDTCYEENDMVEPKG